MIKKTISCPKCNYVTVVSGEPDTKIIIKCPICNTKGCYTFPKNNHNFIMNDKKLVDYKIHSLISTVLFIVFIFGFESYISFLLIFILGLVLFFINIDSRVPYLYGSVIIFISLILSIFAEIEEIANDLIIYGFILLVVGLLCMLKNYSILKRLMQIL